MTDARPVLLIDFSAVFRRCWHVSSELSHAYEGTIAGVNRASGMLPEALVAICCDGRGNWRKELSKEYKAQRESQPQQMFGEMDRTLDRLRRDGRLIWKFDGFEADDVIATAVQMATTRGHWCRIVSHDKDLLQLLSVACDFLAIHKTPWEVVDRDIVLDKYGVTASQFQTWLALVGDNSDNVKGCPGVGGGSATELLKRYESVNGIRHALTLKCIDCSGTGKSVGERGEIKCKTCKGTGDFQDGIIGPNMRKNLAAFLAPDGGFELANKLVSLRRDVPIKFDEIYETREIAPIDERDMMSEAEKDADKFFGYHQKGASAQAETLAAERTEEQTEQAEGKIETIPQGPAPSADVARRDKTPEEIAEVSRPVETALVPVVEYTRQLEPRSFRDASIAAGILFNSRVYSRYPTKESMLAAIIRGREMGYGVGASLDMFHVADFNNDGNLRLMMHAHLIVEQAMRHPGVEYIMMVSSSDQECTYEFKRKEWPKAQTLQYTIEDAKTADLVRPTRSGKPSMWMKRPKEQLRKTCGAQSARVVCPGGALGLYCPEEMGIET